VQIGLDDFGTGFSSLAYLKRFPIDFVKIDRTFTDGLGVEDNDTAIVRATIALAQSLGIHVIAEGVESEDEIERLKSLNCRYAQGFAFGAAMPGAELQRKIAAQIAAASGRATLGAERSPSEAQAG